MLEKYLDGQLSPAEKERVEEALRTKPGAQAQVKLQHEVDDALARLFGPNDAALKLPAAGGGGRRLAAWGLAAAVVLIGLVGVWAAFLRGPGPGSHGSVASASPLGPLYRAQVASGFVPKEVCTTRDEFAKWVQTYYQQPLYPAAAHEGVEFVGWSNAPAIGKNSGVLLAKVRGKEVIVVMDRKVLEKSEITGTGDPGLHSFRKQFGAIVLYEVSPLDQAAILPLLSATPGG